MITRWLGEMPFERFLADHFQREPLARPHVAREAEPLLDWRAVAQLVDANPDMLVVRNAELWRDPGPADFAEARALFRRGWSLVLRACEEHDQGLRALAEAFAAIFAGDVSIQVYATPAGYQSFGWHYDCEDVFIVQTHGAKDYKLRRNTVNPEPTIDAMPRDMRFELETTPAIACTLIAGDFLYIPRGWWHVAAAQEDSLSISVGVLTPAARGSKRTRWRGARLVI